MSISTNIFTPVPATAMHDVQAWTQAPLWEKGTFELICRQVIDETPDVRTFVFQLANKTRFSYKPGQHIILMQELDGEMVYRAYTISSTPSRPYTLNLTIQRVDGGRLSGWLFDNILPGSTIQATGPGGEFNLVDIPARKVLFLSAGCGITPMISMSRWLLDTCTDADIRFVHSAASTENIVYRRELEMLDAQHDCFQLSCVLDDRDGLLNRPMLEQLVPDLHSRTIYVCGTPGYIDAVQAMAKESGFAMDNFHYEQFSGYTPEAETPAAADTSAQGFTVSLEKTGAVVQMSPDELLVDTLLANKAPIVAACRAGVCGACKVKVIDGEVESSSQMTLTPAEIEQGYVLSCCSKPRSDLQVDV